MRISDWSSDVCSSDLIGQMRAECGMKASPAIVDAVGRARAHAPFLSLLLDREPALAAMLDEGGWPGLESARAEDDGQSVGTWLRVARRRLALLVAIGDLAGHLDLTQVTGALTGFADHALDLAIRTAIAERTPDAEPVG